MGASAAALRLTRLRRLADLSMRELADLARLTESAVRHFESGLHGTMKAESLSRLGNVLGARLSYLLHGTGSGPSDARVLAAVARARKPARRRAKAPAEQVAA